MGERRAGVALVELTRPGAGQLLPRRAGVAGRRVARVVLEREGLRVVGVAATAAQALRRAAELRPEVVLVDIMLGGESGFDLVRRLSGHDRGGGAAVILMSTYAEADFADLIAESPATGVLVEGRAVGGRDPADRRWRRASRPAGARAR